jgi:phosphoribosylformylglycinamidine synthase subunit PurQ / glutaminase
VKAVGVVRFPGTNCDQDVFEAVGEVGLSPQWLWHADRFDPKSIAAVVLPGGFSYGDYLRCGALAAKAPAMASVREFAASGGPVLGVCNGFQILCESGLLPGALVRNHRRRFVDQWVELKLTQSSPKFGPSSGGVKVRLPVAHGEGRFHAEEATLKRLEDRGQVWLNYLEDVNGSVNKIAGVLNETRNVAGLMPHPERAMHGWMGGTDGRTFFTSLL